ncbi:Uncharacterised protein r2_g969 [Pycnogonum litorale]
MQKLARCNYVAYLWKHAHLRDPLENIQPTDHGWKEVNGDFVRLWFTGSQMPTMRSKTMEPEDVTDGDEDDDDNYDYSMIITGDDSEDEEDSDDDDNEND